MKIKLKTLLIILLLGCNFAFADEYPKIDVSGFKKWEYKDAQVNPQSNYFLGLTHLGGYSPTTTGSPWQERLQLTILGQLTNKLSVAYDVEQQPDTPDKYDVKVNYDNKHQLTFGDFSANFSGNEFASATKFLNGVMITSKDDNYDFIAVPSAKLKSQIQGLTSQKGNNSKGPYSLGHGSIFEGSERIELNGILLKRGTDYLIDYFEGKVTFMQILTQADEFKYSYEYTNLLDLFFPALSKKDFFGAQGRFTIDPSAIGQKVPVAEPKTSDYEQYFPTGSRNGRYDIVLSSVSIESTSATIESMSASLESTVATLETSPKPVISDDILANESIGKYQLKNLPIVPFSETLVFKGTVLKKNEDYTIKYEDGTLSLLIPVIPTIEDPLQIAYKYYFTATATDPISGNGGRGPYDIKQKSIVQKSEKVLLDGRLLIRDYDYIMDYAQGKISFNYSISNTSQISITYNYQVLELPPAPPAQKYPKSLTLGMTYLKESSKKGVSSATADLIESRTGSQIINNSNTIYLSKFPVVSSAEGGSVVVRINGNIATSEIDYAIPTIEVDAATGNSIVIPQAQLAFINDRADTSTGYTTGTIKLLASIEATSEVSVVYSYKKSIVGRFTGIGNGSRGPYYIKNIRNLVPGSERVDVWTTGSPVTDTYTRNSSFDADAGDLGYSINYNQDSPYITFNKELQPSQNFSTYFQYIAPQGNEGGDISQDLTGFDAAIKFGDVLQFDGNYARSSTDQVINAVGTSDSFSNFPGPTNKITLRNKPVIENSEKVYVNNYLRNKDIDYFIDYTSGIMSFYYVTLSTLDVVSVDYQYQSAQGVSLGETQKIGQALKYGVKSTLGKVSVAYNSKEIGFDFNPLGGTAIGVGSNYRDFSVALAPLAHDFQSSYTYRETNNPIGTTRKFYSRNYDRSYTAGITPFGLGRIDLGYRNSELKGDPADIGGAITADNSMNSYSIGISPQSLKNGIFNFNQRYDAQRSISEDRLSYTRGKIESGHVNYSLGVTDRVKLSTDYQVSEPLTFNTQTSETKVAWSLSRDLGYDISIDLTFPRVKKLTTYAKLLNHESMNYLPSPESRTATRNTTYHVDFNPIDIVSTNYDYNRQETPSVVIDGKNPKSERTSTNLNILPHPALSTGWSHAEDLTINESARESSGNSNTYVANWTPISYEKVKLTSNYTLYGRLSMAPYGTADATTDTRSFVQDYTITLAPISIITITPGFVQEEYFNSTSTATIELKTQNKTVKFKINFRPIVKLSMDADYNLKVTTSVTDNLNRHKNWMSLRTGYKVFSWGELVHLLEEEHNQGEVQAGGVLPNLDYLKTTNTFSLNFTVPQDNPIISSFVLTATYKLVKFENRLRPSDDLFGYLMSFEGTLNF